MAVLSTAIALAGLAVAGAGTYMQYQGAKQQAEYQKQQAAEQQKVTELQQQAEFQRQQQMKLDAMRRRREIVRQGIAARAMALSTTTNQGANGGGSALAGAYGGISGRTNVNLLGVNQNEEIGNTMFGINRGILGHYGNIAQLQGLEAGAKAYGAMGGALTSLGGMAMKNNDTIARVGSWAYGKMTG